MSFVKKDFTLDANEPEARLGISQKLRRINSIKLNHAFSTVHA